MKGIIITALCVIGLAMGEAAPSQSYFSKLPKTDRAAVLKFLGSL
ncbi:MAG: hypothetical protein JWQ66_3024 [Mucilaginibacter sp.]|nr:hypothetical protein [Mucilaginibacter sp.]